MKDVLRIAVAGATGRLGRRIVALAAEDRELAVVAALTRAGHPLLGRDAGESAGLAPLGIPLETLPRARFDVLVDASTAAATRDWVELCVERRAALVIAVTGHEAGDLGAIEAAASTIPILKASNLGFGANLLRRLAADLARRLGAGFDVEVVEAHHRGKRDRPSGTALEIARDLAAAAGKEPPVHSLRLGAVVGDHTVRFASTDEELVLTHRALSRDAFARGALRAAKWLATRGPGLHAIDDLLASP